MAAGVETRESAEGARFKSHVTGRDVGLAINRGAPWRVVCGLLQRWSEWRGIARFGGVVGRVYEDDDILELGFAPWVKNIRTFKVDLGKPAGRRLVECIGEMKRSGERMALPALSIKAKGEDFEGLDSYERILEIRLLPSDNFEMFCKWLRGGGAPMLHTLDLFSNKIGEGMCWFSEILVEGKLSSLHTLNLYGNILRDEGMVELSEAVSTGALPSLHTLSLGWNEIHVESMLVFSEVLSEGALPSLHTLYLGHNRLDDISRTRLKERLSRIPNLLL